MPGSDPWSENNIPGGGDGGDVLNVRHTALYYWCNIPLLTYREGLTNKNYNSENFSFKGLTD